MSKIIFRGAGCNGPTLLTAISRSMGSPSKDTVPAGATWPLVSLVLDDGSATFSLAHIRRVVIPRDVKKIVLNKNGYIFFRTQDSEKDFGFATLEVKHVLNQLEKQGFILDKSCYENVLIAKISLSVLTIVPLLVVALVLAMSILKPNGI